MKRVTVELLLTDAQVESARIQSTKVGRPGEFDARGLRGAGFVDADLSAITVLEIEDVAGRFGLESWPPGYEPTVADVRTTWHDSAQERELEAHKALRDFRVVRYVLNLGGVS